MLKNAKALKDIFEMLQFQKIKRWLKAQVN